MSISSLSGILMTIAGGLLATACMTAFLYVMQWMHVINGNVMQTIGSMFTQVQGRYTKFGITAHFFAGVVFSFLYALLFAWLNQPNPLVYVAFGAMLGLGHGILASYAILIFVGEHAKSRSFRKQGVNLAAVDWAAHVVYGAVLGMIYALTYWTIRR